MDKRPARSEGASPPAPAAPADPGAGSRPSEHGIAEFVELEHLQTDVGLRHPDVDSKEIIAWWGDLEPEEGRYTWDKMDKLFDAWEAAGKQIRVRLSTAHDGPFYTPDWVLHRYNIRSVAMGTWVDFESPAAAGLTWAEGAAITDAAERVVGGARSLRIDLAGTGPRTVLGYRPQAGFSSGVTYLFDFDYLVSAPGVAGMARFLDAEGREVASERFELIANIRESCCLRLRSPERRAVALELLLEGTAQASVDNLLVTSLVRNPPWRVYRQDDAAPEWELSGGAAWVTDAAGRKAIRLATPGAAISTSPQNAPFAIGESYQGYYGFRKLKPSRMTHRLTDGSADYAQQIFDVNKDGGERGVWFDRSAWKSGQRIEVRLDNDGEMLIYDIGWRCISSQITVFPDYFSPRFAERWAGFVAAFAERYGRRKALATVTIGGFGRWEEVMLDAGQVEPQWRARGYTLDAYLKRIEDCMQLYRRLLPTHPLQVCLAHGITRGGPEAALTYWNVGRLGFANRVGLKQNGLSERYNAFGRGTASNDVTVMYSRYHGTPGMGFAYETGAQIYNNAYGCHGHPISLLNRALIDGVDTLLLYENDVSQATINQFFMPFAAQAGRPAASTLFNQVGRFPLHHPRFGNQDYQHLWFGIRHHTAGGAEPELTSRAGRQCLATRAGNPRIVWDINADTMYAGMYGATLAVEYLDEGTDTFDINAYDKTAGAWQRLTQVRKSGSGAWKTVALQAGVACIENRSGPNEMGDVAIEDNSDGVECVSRVEIQHVPARGWRRDTILELPSTGRSLAIADSVARAITVPADRIVAGIALQFADIDFRSDKVGARVRVFAGAADLPIAEKRVLNPSPGMWYAIPVTPQNGATVYRVQIDSRTGGIAVGAAEDGGMALRVEAYDGVDAASATTVAPGGGTISVASPFAGLRLSGDGDLATTIVTLRKHLDEEGQDTGVCWSTRPIRGADGVFRVHGEPQTGGRYRIELTGAPSAVVVVPILLQHTFTPRPAAVHTSGPAVSGPVAAVQVDGAGPQWDLSVALAASPRHVCRFELTNTTSVSLARVEWWRAGEKDPQTTFISLVPWDAAPRIYHINLGLLPEWSGSIARIRITPARSLYDGGALTGGQLSLHDVVHRGD